MEDDGFVCKECGANISSLDDFNEHVLRHIEEGHYPLDDADEGIAGFAGTPEEDSSFLVRCPYPGCTLRTETYNFPAHVYDAHERCPTQSYDCPICRFIGSETPHGPDFNLVNHLREAHSDMIPDGPVSVMNTGMFDRQDTVIGKSLDSDKACPFCLDGFHSGQDVTILGCLCMYHKECYDMYIEKYPDQPCLEHSQNK